MVDRSKITTYLLFFSASMVLGLLVAFITSFYILYALGRPLNFTGVFTIFDHNKAYYLIKLIPFLTISAGITAAYYYLREKSKTVQEKEEYHKTIETIIDVTDRISKGDLGYSVDSANLNSGLKNALEDMQKYLVSVNKREKERRYISSAIAEINELIRPINEIRALTDEVIKFLVNKIEIAVQGAFYLVVDDYEAQKTLKLASIYAFNRKKHINSTQKFTDGLIGQAALERELIHLTEIPEGYISITSGLIGHRKPNSIVLLPLINVDEVNGVIELASAGKFTELQLRLISELGEIIARSIDHVKANEKTMLLLRDSEKMSAELVEQKIKLEENAQQMIATQEELKNTNIVLEDQIQEVHNTNQKTQIILENSLEIIFIYNSENRTTYVSPSILPVLGYYTEDILGKKCIENIHPLDTTRYEAFIAEIISFPEKRHVIQYRYFTKKGDIIWMEAIGKNSPSELIEGVVINTRDISEQKLAEKEQRIRAKMQALSENSPDVIIRIDIFSRCTYINPAIQNLTGKSITDYIDKPLAKVGLDEGVVSFFKNVLEDVSISGKKKTEELVFPTAEEEKILEVKAIPEFYDNGDVESVLFVCHDITTSRRREEVIQRTNKSIKDSINYAYYIQSSLMPKEQNLRAIIPNSFMMYMPKDIVSGDYPFLYRDKDVVYIGAMDCTGHGVPGALMSIIGHFLQNDIIYDGCEEDAGQILTKLHKNVVSSLRQEDEDSKINDGMDAAFCKINLRTKTLCFAGAHRPLYYVSEGKFTEIRGDKYPVGSTQYSNRKDFTNHTISIKQGDAFYLTTDGYADQYGGPDGKSKFLSGRLNLLIKENTNLSIFQMGNLLRKTHEDWKGEVEQLDDILVIGLKF